MTRCVPIVTLLLLLCAGTLAAQSNYSPLFIDTTNVDIPAAVDQTSALVLADMDGDGDLDLLVGNGTFTAADNMLYKNSGKGWFADYTPRPFPAHAARTKALAVGDVDGDGDMDVVTGDQGSQNRLLLNPGDAHLVDVTMTNLPVLVDQTEDLALVDVDGDNDLDLLVINDMEQNRLYLNNGSGFFTDVTATNLPAAIDAAWSLAVADVDGDGDMDFCIGKWGTGNDGQNRLYLNDGSGVFTDVTTTNLPANSERTFCLTFGDVDGDGDQDLVYGNAGPNTLLLNDGTGIFTPAPSGRLPLDTQVPGSVHLADLDGDGDLDMVIGNFNVNWGRNQLYFNNGSGTFHNGTDTALPLEIDATHCIALGDVDGDGDLDMITGNVADTGQQNRVYRNLIRQFQPLTPFQGGSTYSFRVHSRPTQGSPLLVVVPMLSAGEMAINIAPYGRFGLDFNVMIALTPKVTGMVTHAADFSLPVPAYPELIGLTFYFQALVEQQLGSGKSWRFTNTVSEVVVRPVSR